MKGLVYYYSSTGNTKLAVNYIKKHIANAEIEMCDITSEKIARPDEYDIVGFASFSEYLGPPTLMKRFIETLGQQDDKPAFVFNTYAGAKLLMQSEFAKQVEARGFKVVVGHSLMMPMNYPPMRRRGKHAAKAPTAEDMSNFNDFISKIEKIIGKIEKAEELKSVFSGLGLKKLVPSMPGNKVKKDFGTQKIDKEKCINCGNCVRVCGYNAIEMRPGPEVDHNKCNGCWACYNTCPKQAIQVNSFTGELQYKGPSKDLIDRMS